MSARSSHAVARSALLALSTATFLAAAAPVSAQKTDVVVLRRGDRITGEIQELNRGKLSYKTDDMGTVNIEWLKIAHVTSTHYFEIELESAAKHYGRLSATADPGTMLVILTDTLTVRMADVVYIVPIEAGFWQRLDGYVDLGFDFQKANRNRSLTASGEVSYRGERWESKLTASSYFQRQQDTEGTSRNSVTLDAARLLLGRWSIIGLLHLEQNAEIALDLRTTVGAGAARDLFQTNLHTLQVIAALAYANERFSTEASGTNTIQLPVAARYSRFKFHDPKVDATITLSVIPILSDLGRVRIGFDSRITYELLSDFFLGLSIFDDFDSRSPSTGASTNDFGLTVSIGYSW